MDRCLFMAVTIAPFNSVWLLKECEVHHVRYRAGTLVLPLPQHLLLL